MPPPEIPQSIGRYEITGRLGRGGMGMVFRGRDPKIGRQVAIKLLHVDDANQRERFLQEAQSAGRLKHPNIVTIYDFGEHEGKPFIVMEFVEGVTLAEEISHRSDWPLSQKLDLIEALAEGLEYAHVRGIVHRDVKPANLMLDQEGVLKILDFGIARVSNSGLTKVGMLMGTPNYMSPEQIEGKTVDRRSDIFAVGVVCYELLSGQKAFAGDTVAHVMTRILRELPVPLAELCPGLDSGLVGVVERALRKNPDRRYQTLAEMAADIRAARKRLAQDDAGALERSTIQMIPPGGLGKRPTPRPGLDRNALSRMRTERIEAQLREAQDAFNAGDYEDAVSACEQAALIDPDDRRVLELLARASAALTRRQVGECLIDARAHLDRGDLDRAHELVVYALDIDPSSQEAARFKTEIETRERNRDDERRRREASLVELVAARKLLSDGEIEAAIRAASDILISDPGNQEARELTRSAVAALEERRNRERQAQMAANLVEEQRRAFAAGRRQEAIAALEAVSPRHDIVDAGVAELRAALAAIERKEADDRARQRREQAEVAIRADAANQAIARARQALASRDFKAAFAALDQAARLDPAHPDLAGLRAAVSAGVDAEKRAEELSRNARTPTPAPMPVPSPAPSPVRTQVRDIEVPPVDPSRSTEWKLALASLPIVIAVLAGGIWWLTRGTDDGGATTSIFATTTILPPATTTIQPTTSIGAARPAELLRAIASTDKLRRSGNLRGAARELERALGRWPGDAELLALLEQIAGEASASADRAKATADRVPEARDRKEYKQAVALLGSAGRSRGDRRIERATDQYLTAAQLFTDSMKATEQAQLTTTSIPMAASTTVPTTSSSTSTVRSSSSTTSVVPRMSDADAAQVLTRWAAAYAKWDLNGLRALYPRMPRNDELALNAERDSFRTCVHVFSNMRVSGTLAEPRIDADAIKTCTPNTRQPPKPENQHHIFDLQRQANGSWIITRHSR